MRSLLFVPADRPDRFEKACGSGADAVIIDLEDAVAPQDKGAARASLASWLTPARNVLVRVNAPGSQWFADDMALARLPGVRGIVLPKAERVQDVSAVVQACVAGVVLPLIETARGIRDAEAIAGVPGVSHLVFGSIDLQLDLGILGDDDELLFFRSQLVLASRLARIAPPIDGVCTAIDDPERLRLDAQRARAFGFGGKLCIHPRQVQTVNQAFLPTADELRWARRVLSAAAESRGAAVRLDGQMIDRPVVLRAEAIVHAVEAQERL